MTLLLKVLQALYKQSIVLISFIAGIVLLILSVIEQYPNPENGYRVVCANDLNLVSILGIILLIVSVSIIVYVEVSMGIDERKRLDPKTDKDSSKEDDDSFSGEDNALVTVSILDSDEKKVEMKFKDLAVRIETIYNKLSETQRYVLRMVYSVPISNSPIDKIYAKITNDNVFKEIQKKDGRKMVESGTALRYRLKNLEGKPISLLKLEKAGHRKTNVIRLDYIRESLAAKGIIVT